MTTSHCNLTDVSIVVLSYNRRDAIARNLATLLDLVEQTGCELVVVDNASADGSADVIRNLLNGRDHTVFIPSPINLGVAGGRNLGWREATRGHILSIDDDTIVSAEAVEALMAAMHRDSQLGIASPRIIHAKTGASQLSFSDGERQLSNFHGACHLIRRPVLDAIGYNDEGCAFGGEELDLSIRARAAGFAVEYVGQALVLHDNFARPGDEGRDRRERWIYNFTRVFNKHFPLAVAVPFSLRNLLSHIVVGGRSFGPWHSLALIGAAARGFRDGRRTHKSVPAAVVQFYRDPTLRPEYGNVPVWRKLMQRLAS